MVVIDTQLNGQVTANPSPLMIVGSHRSGADNAFRVLERLQADLSNKCGIS
jgi:hypothetical protein